MAGRSLHRAHLALPFGLLGLLGASMIAEHYGLSGGFRDGLARGPLTLLLPLVAALLGLLLSARAITSRLWATALVVIVGTELAAAAIGYVTDVAVWPQNSHQIGVVSGLVTGLAFLPVVAFIVRLARRVGRARAGSFVDEADQRAPWMMVALGVALFQGPVAYGAHRIHHVKADVTAALGLLAFGSVFVMTALDMLAYRRANVSVLEIGSMRRREPNAALECEHIEDLGLGDEEHEELEGGIGYRGSPRPIRVIRGDMDLSIPALRHAVTRSCYAFLAALIGCAVPYLMLGTRFGVFRFFH